MNSKNQSKRISWAKQASFLATTGLIALSALAGCSSEPKKRSQPPENKSQLAPDKPTKEKPTPVSEASTELLQKSVARVLGFTDVGGVALRIFQDTESALYETIAVQASTPTGTAPDPIFYYSPVFIAGSPKLLPLSTGELNVTIPNNFTQAAVRELISDKMAVVLEAYKIKTERIGMIPMEGIKVTVKAFGNTYTDNVSMDNEFRTIVFKVPGADVPQLVLEALKASAGSSGQDPGLIFLDNISLIQIDFNYFVQQYGSQQCRMNVTTEDIRNMYMDQTGCPPGPDETEVTEALAWVKQQKGESAADSVNSKLAAIMKQTSAVTACLAGNEARKLQAAASVSCTKGGTRDSDQKGQNDFSPLVIDFLQKTIKPTLTSKVMKSTDVKTWDDELIAATIQMFGSPERFKSTIDGINSEIQNKNVTELDNDYYNKAAAFSDTLKNYDTFNQADSYVDKQGRVINQEGGQSASTEAKSETQQNSKGGGGGFNVGFAGVGLGAGSNDSRGNGSSSGSNSSQYAQNYKASDDFKRDYNEFHNIARSMSLETDTEASENVRQTSEYLYNMGFDHSIEKVNGKFNIFPKLNLSVKVDANRADEAAQSFKTNELGNIVVEDEQIPVQLKDIDPAKLIVKFQCNAGTTPASWPGTTATLSQYQWWNSDAFWKKLSDQGTLAVFEGGCSFLGVKMWYRNAAENPGMVPKVVDATVYGVVVRTTVSPDGKTNEFFERSLPIAVELRRENTEAKPAEGSIAIDAKTSRFTKIRISQQ